MKEFVKVSIHNHFGGGGADKKLNENYKKNISFDMKESIKLIDDAKEHGYDLLVMTNSNNINYAHFLLLKKYANMKEITLLPGIEVNLKNQNEEKFLHVVVIFRDSSAIFSISNQINESIISNKKSYLDLKQFIDVISIDKCIIAAHGIKQSDDERSGSTNPDTFSELISMSNSIPIVIEDNKEYHKITLRNQLENKLSNQELKWLDEAAVLSSADRMSFSEIISPTFVWGEATFDDIYYACFMGNTRIKRASDIVNKVNYISRIEILNSTDTQISSGTIDCSHGLNAVIGSSGSGKTLLLDIIKKKLTGENLENKTISSECDYNEIYNTADVVLYDSEGEPINDNSTYEVIEGEILYNKVIRAYQSNKEKLLKELNLEINLVDVNKYLDSFMDKLNEYVATRIKIEKNRKAIALKISSLASTIKFLNANILGDNEAIDYVKGTEHKTKITNDGRRREMIVEDLIVIKKVFDKLKGIGKRYKFNDEFESDLKQIEDKINKSIKYWDNRTLYSLVSHDTIDEKQTLIFNETQKYNEKIGTQSKTVIEKKQELVNIYEEIKELVYLNVLLKRGLRIPILVSENIKKSIRFTNKDFAKLTVNEINLVVDKGNFKDIFPSNIGTKPKINYSKFEMSELNLASEESVSDFVEVFVSEEYQDRIQLVYSQDPLINYDIELKNIEGIYENINIISAGNLSKIYINQMFEERINNAGSNVIVLYDQPDTNMEKLFVLDNLSPKISKLREKYQVFITTHEALLVVNADANNIIVATNNKNISKENDIKYENKSFTGAKNKMELVMSVAQLIDGHPDAIKKRNTIYGGLLNES